MNGNHLDVDQLQITEVWANNLSDEFQRIRDVVEHYQYIAMDTEFPGIVARPTGNVTEYNYQTVKCNVDLLKVIQLGITFADSHGNLARGTSTWQFNFRFDLDRDMYAQDSIDFLKQSGIDFEKQQREGIDLQDFGELIMSSGLVMNEDVKWISFHGCYDFGYLLKLLTCAPLPESEAQFFELLHDFFPALYDIKFLLRNIKNLCLNGGSSLQRIAEHLNVRRVGPQHQAGSDSLVTCRTFFKLMETYFENQIDDSKFSGVIYGIGAAVPPKLSRSPGDPETPEETLLAPSSLPSSGLSLPMNVSSNSTATSTSSSFSSSSPTSSPSTPPLPNPTVFLPSSAIPNTSLPPMGMVSSPSLPSDCKVSGVLSDVTSAAGNRIHLPLQPRDCRQPPSHQLQRTASPSPYQEDGDGKSHSQQQPYQKDNDGKSHHSQQQPYEKDDDGQSLLQQQSSHTAMVFGQLLHNVVANASSDVYGSSTGTAAASGLHFHQELVMGSAVVSKAPTLSLMTSPPVGGTAIGGGGSPPSLPQHPQGLTSHGVGMAICHGSNSSTVTGGGNSV